MNHRLMGVLIAVLVAAPWRIAAQPLLCDAEPGGGTPRPIWSELAAPDGSGYPDYRAVSTNLKLLDSLQLLASLLTRAAESLQSLTSEVEDPEAEGRCVCCVSANCALPEIYLSVKRADCTATQCNALEAADYPIWLPTDLFEDPKKTARFALRYLEFLDDIQAVITKVSNALTAAGMGIEDAQQLIASYLVYVDRFTEGFHLGGYSIERPNLHLCVGYGGHGAYAEMLSLLGEISIGGRYTSENLSAEHRAQFRAGGFGVSAFGRTISLLPGVEADLQIDGFKLWDGDKPFGVELGLGGDPSCADGDGFRLTDIESYDVFHLLDPSTDLAPFDTSGDGCLQGGEMLIVDFYEARYRSAADGMIHDWPRPTFPYDWEKRNTAVVSAGLNLPLKLEPIEKLLPPGGIPLFTGATLFPRLTLRAGAEWKHQVNQLRERLQDAINRNLPASAQLDGGDFERPMHDLQAPDVSEDNGNSAFVQPRVAADLVLGIALARYLTLGITVSIGTSVRVEPTAHGGVHDLNVALADALQNSNPPPNLPCDPTIEVKESTICSNGLHQSYEAEPEPALVALSTGDYTCDSTQVATFHCADPEEDKECMPESAAEDCPETRRCVVEYGCAAHGYCTRLISVGPDEKEGTDDDVVDIEHDTTYQACIGEAVCDDAAVNAGAACAKDEDCFGPLQCVGGMSAGMACDDGDACRDGECKAPSAPCVVFSPVGYFTPYQCLVRDEPEITGWHGPGCHPLTFGFPSACGCAGDSDCVGGQEVCVSGVCAAAGQPVPCACDPTAPAPCGAGRLCVEGACVLDCGANGDADCAAEQICMNGHCANPYGIPFAEQIVWQVAHTPVPQHAVASYALSDILASAILDAGLRLGLDLKIFKKLYHFEILDLRDYWTLLALNKSWYQPGLEARYQNDCAALVGDTVSNWQPGAQRVKRYNPLAAADGSYGNAGTIGDLQQWCLAELPNDVADPDSPDDGDITSSMTDLADWGVAIGQDVWAQGGLCVTHRNDGVATSMPVGEWLASLDANSAALACTYTHNSQGYGFPCADLANQALLIWGCLDTDANPFAPLLASIPGIVTTFDGHPVFDLAAMLIDPSAELTLDNLKPGIRSIGLNAGVFWYSAVTQCFEQNHAALQPGDVQIGGVLLGPCCGNGSLDSGGCAQGEGVPPCEVCDDGNTSGGDGCSPLCRIEGRPRPLGECGNGLVEKQDFEECDDGNQDPGDGCEPDCKLPLAPSTPTPVGRATDTPTRVVPATPTRGIFCVGDCDRDNSVSIAELVTGVRIALALAVVADCDSFDAGGDGRVTVDELIRAVAAALRGC